MKERPILFSGPMVRALLAGTKTQTRRVVKPTPPAGADSFGTYYHPDPRPHFWAFGGDALMDFAVPCPYGQPGDRLWVRETWGYFGGDEYLYQQDTGSVGYRASQVDGLDHIPGGRWRPSIHMPRWASRITLEVTGVRVERLQGISDADAVAEGIEKQEDGIGWKRGPISGDHPNTATRTAFPKIAFQSLWESINGPDSWAANPWVWAVEFKATGAQP